MFNIFSSGIPISAFFNDHSISVKLFIVLMLQINLDNCNSEMWCYDLFQHQIHNHLLIPVQEYGKVFVHKHQVHLNSHLHQLTTLLFPGIQNKKLHVKEYSLSYLQHVHQHQILVIVAQYSSDYYLHFRTMEFVFCHLAFLGGQLYC